MSISLLLRTQGAGRLPISAELLPSGGMQHTQARVEQRRRDQKTGQPLDDERLLPEVATFFFAGEDTTSHTASWTL